MEGVMIRTQHEFRAGVFGLIAGVLAGLFLSLFMTAVWVAALLIVLGMAGGIVGLIFCGLLLAQWFERLPTHDRRDKTGRL
jgi:hypothetical protein